MSRITLSILFLFALLAWLGGQIFFGGTQNEETEPGQASENEPNYQAFAMHSVLFGKDGSISHEVYAQKMAHFDHQRETQFSQPRYVVYTSSRKNPWQISALEGILSGEDSLSLNQGVMIQSTDDKGLVQTIQTSSMEVNLDSKEIVSQQAVVISGANYIIESQGIRANLEKNTFEIGQHVETTFQPAIRN